MRDFVGGWNGLKEFAIECGVATVDDTEDAVAEKIKAVIQGVIEGIDEEALPEEETAPAKPVADLTGGGPSILG